MAPDSRSPPRTPPLAGRDRAASGTAGSVAGRHAARSPPRSPPARMRPPPTPLLLVRPDPAPLHARDHRHLAHRTVANTGANTVACTSATSATQPRAAKAAPTGGLPSRSGTAACGLWITTAPSRHGSIRAFGRNERRVGYPVEPQQPVGGGSVGVVLGGQSRQTANDQTKP